MIDFTHTISSRRYHRLIALQYLVNHANQNQLQLEYETFVPPQVESFLYIYDLAISAGIVYLSSEMNEIK